MIAITRQEKLVLIGLTQGHTDERIAAAMQTTLQDIARHRKALLAKTGAKNEYDLIEKAAEWPVMAEYEEPKQIEPAKPAPNQARKKPAAKATVKVDPETADWPDFSRRSYKV